MEEDIQGLIEKIQEEGVKEAEVRARQIEQSARSRAKQIVEEAQEQARQIHQKTQAEIETDRKNSEESLRQAARDLIISLRTQIRRMLDGVVKEEVSGALSAQDLQQILSSLIKSCSKESGGRIEVTLSQTDEEKLRGHFLSALRAELRDGVTLKSSDGIAAGFTISFDAGSSQYDFTDKAITEYLGKTIKPALARIFSEASG